MAEKMNKIYVTLFCLCFCQKKIFPNPLPKAKLNTELQMIYKELSALYSDLDTDKLKQIHRPQFEDINPTYDQNPDPTYRQNSDEIYGPDRAIALDEEREKYMPLNGELFDGDIIMDERLRRVVDGAYYNKKSVISNLELRWKDGIVPYEIDKSLDPEIRRLLIIAIKEFRKRTCIRLIPRTNEKDYVLYTSEENICSSHIGRIGGMQKIYLGKGCSVLGTVEHETMHSLGFIHEHSRPDRSLYIKVFYENIRKEDKINFQKYTTLQVTTIVEYNFNSLMQYRANAFSNKDGENTIVPLDLHDVNYPFGQRKKFSTSDVKQINLVYDCKRELKDPASYKDLIKSYSGYRKEQEKKRDQKK